MLENKEDNTVGYAQGPGKWCCMHRETESMVISSRYMCRGKALAEPTPRHIRGLKHIKGQSDRTQCHD